MHVTISKIGPLGFERWREESQWYSEQHIFKQYF